MPDKRSAADWQSELDALEEAIERAERERYEQWRAWWQAVRAGELQLADALREGYLELRRKVDRLNEDFDEVTRERDRAVTDHERNLLGEVQ